MKRLILCSIAALATGLLVGCEESPQHTGSTSYGYQAAPSSYSEPSRYGQLPDRSESAGSSASVQGFPPGHPLHKEDSYNSTMQHQSDENALLEQRSASSSTSLPRSNFNY